MSNDFNLSLELNKLQISYNRLVVNVTKRKLGAKYAISHKCCHLNFNFNFNFNIKQQLVFYFNICFDGVICDDFMHDDKLFNIFIWQNRKCVRIFFYYRSDQ